jgi:hypothetical protein
LSPNLDNMKAKKNNCSKFNLISPALVCGILWFISNQTIAQGSFDQVQGSLYARNELICLNSAGCTNYPSSVVDLKKIEPVVSLVVIAIDTNMTVDFSWIKRYRTDDENSSFKISRNICFSGISSNENTLFRSMPVIGLGVRFRIF